VSGVQREQFRPWQEIAAELANEKDSNRVFELAKELTVALDEKHKPAKQATNNQPNKSLAN
jgi:hypothetical protein